MSCCFSYKVKDKRKKKKRVDSRKLESVFEPRPILKNDKKKNRRKSIYPMTTSRQEQMKKNKEELEERHTERKEFLNLFLSERLICGGCQEHFSLGDHAIKTNCSSCNQFFHCHIAGACVGPNCSVIVDGKAESLKYCMSCVNPYLRINIEDNGQCLCKDCEKSVDIPNYYKAV
jgi:hypothetical protein